MDVGLPADAMAAVREAVMEGMTGSEASAEELAALSNDELLDQPGYVHAEPAGDGDAEAEAEPAGQGAGAEAAPIAPAAAAGGAPEPPKKRTVPNPTYFTAKINREVRARPAFAQAAPG